MTVEEMKKIIIKESPFLAGFDNHDRIAQAIHEKLVVKLPEVIYDECMIYISDLKQINPSIKFKEQV